MRVAAETATTADRREHEGTDQRSNRSGSSNHGFTSPPKNQGRAESYDALRRPVNAGRRPPATFVSKKRKCEHQRFCA